MPRPAKIGGLLKFRAVCPTTNRILRDDDRKPIVVSAYTAKAAKHQFKKITDEGFVVEEMK